MFNVHFQFKYHTQKSPWNHKICALEICMAFNCVHVHTNTKIKYFCRHHRHIFAIICVSLAALFTYTQTRSFFPLWPQINFLHSKLHSEFFTLFSLRVYETCETANYSLLWIIYTVIHTDIRMLAACTYNISTWTYHAHSRWMKGANDKKKLHRRR